MKEMGVEKMKLKRLATCVLAISFATIMSVSAFAATPPLAEEVFEDNIGRSRFQVESTPDGAYVSGEMQLQEHNAKLEAAMELMAEKDAKRARASWVQLPGTFYVYAQSTSYNCVPASTQGILRYINGTTPPSQATIASAMGTTSSNGTDMNVVPGYLNSKQSKNRYIIINRTKDLLYSTKVAIDLYKVPVMYRMKFRSSDGWDYSTDGHAMNAYAIMSNESDVMLTDPWMGYAGIGSGSYSKSGIRVFNANTHLIW